MTKVNQEVQQAADSTIYIWQSLLDLWALVPIELKMYLAVMYITSVIVQYYKVTRLNKLGTSKAAQETRLNKIKTAGLPLAILTSIGASFVYKDLMHYGWFIFAGLTAFRSAMIVHSIVIDFIIPKIKKISNIRFATVDEEKK